MATADTMVGRRLGRYLVQERIGSGGMGVVFRAHDEQLERDVAIKVLNAYVLSNDGDRKRLKNEARALSRLNHPNIETIYSFETEGDIEFLVIELLTGSSLAEKHTGPRSESEVARFGIQIAEALTAAHRQGVIHRDLKPGNVFLTKEGQIKVLDFGLAKLHALADTDRTESLSLHLGPVGTLPYMAPEQLMNGTVDERSDIYSFGALLYEMATTERPFQNKTAASLQHAIAHELPISPHSLNTGISSELDRIILKCLEKDPDARYQSAREIGIDLQRLTSYVSRQSVAPPPKRAKKNVAIATAVALIVALGIGLTLVFNFKHPKPQAEAVRIAVLPFDTRGAGPEREYVAEGLADEVAGLLSRVHTLQVIAPTSIQRSDKAAPTLAEISKQLGASYFVTGTVEWDGQRIRIRVRMLDASTGILWARSYDRTASNSLAIENEVAQDVVQSLAVSLGREESQILSTPPTQNPEAYDSYLRGKSLVVSFNNRGQEEDFTAAEAALRKAIQLDRQMAAAYGELAHLYFLHDIERARTTSDSQRLRTAAEQALAIDPKQLAALDALAMMHIFLMQDDTAYAYALKVLAVNPNDPGGLMVLGAVYADSGLLEDALAAFRKAGEAEPLYLYPMTNAAEVLVMMGRLDEAWKENEDAAAIEPDNYSVLQKRAWIRYQQGRLDEAEQVIQYAMPRVSPAERSGIELIQAWIYSRRGLHDQARALLEKVADSPLVHESLDLQLWLAEGWALENEPDKSLPVFATVAAARSNYPWYARDPNLQSLRGTPAFDKLLSDVKARWERNREKFRSSSEVLHVPAA